MGLNQLAPNSRTNSTLPRRTKSLKLPLVSDQLPAPSPGPVREPGPGAGGVLLGELYGTVAFNFGRLWQIVIRGPNGDVESLLSKAQELGIYDQEGQIGVTGVKA